jgi:rSAM/selenodomain-associated transferase 1
MMDALIIMTRVPIPNKTNTRLMDIYTGVECCRLHKCFLKDVFSVCDKLKNNMDIYITYTPEDSNNELKGLIPGYMVSFPQHGKDLGERMYNSINHLLKLGYGKVILIGSDIPELKPEYIINAFENLNSSDICIGPTYDGGYYLIGMKEAQFELFNSNVSWGKKTVFDRTVEIAERNKLAVSYTDKCRDIDTKEDIRDFLSSVDRYGIGDYPQYFYFYVKNNWRECFLGEI